MVFLRDRLFLGRLDLFLHGLYPFCRDLVVFLLGERANEVPVAVVRPFDHHPCIDPCGPRQPCVSVVAVCPFHLDLGHSFVVVRRHGIHRGLFRVDG